MSVFKANDIRGRYPDELEENLFARIGHAVAGMVEPAATFLVGGDVRPSTPALLAALSNGLRDAGANVRVLGVAPTPVHYFALRQALAQGRQQQPEVAGLLIVTASHNPPGDNGLKLSLHGEPPTPELLESIRQRTEIDSPGAPASRGRIETLDAVPDYVDWITQRFSPCDDSHPNVVVDAGNGTWSDLAPQILRQCGYRIRPLYCEADGSYPNRKPDSANPAHLEALRRLVVEEHADIGVAFDGDGDRVSFVTNAGRFVTADETAYLLAGWLLEGTSGETVVQDLKLSRIIKAAVEANTGQLALERSGHAYIKRRMLEENALFGCEASGHYFYRELAGGDDGLFTALLLLDFLRRKGVTLDQCLCDVPPHVITPDIRLEMGAEDARELIERVAAREAVERVNRLDGVRVEYPEGWALARVSITEPRITFRFEADSAETLPELVDRFLQGEQGIRRQIKDETGW